MDNVRDLVRQAVAHMLPVAKRLEFEVCTAWADVVGPEIASRTWPVRVTEGTLFVATSQAAWATELGYMGEELREKLNAALDAEAVSRIKFVVRARSPQDDETT